jgi:hypothetical protein
MSDDKFIVVDVDDVLAIRIRCGRCGSAVVIRPTEWRDLPSMCPGCDAAWNMDAMPDHSAAYHLARSPHAPRRGQARHHTRRGTGVPRPVGNQRTESLVAFDRADSRPLQLSCSTFGNSDVGGT